MLRLYNTLTRSVEEFVPQEDSRVKMYSCGPTVYDYQHIGHMRRYVGDDILVRVLQANGYMVHHVMNITDVGHLVSDSDTGEDKMEKGAAKYGKSVWDLANMFEEQFKDSCALLDIRPPKDVMHATDYIKEQIALVQILEQKGYTYRLDDGIYFDTAKFKDYFKLSRQNPEELKKGARVDFIEGKRNVSDFALWKFSFTSEGSPRRQMEWWSEGPLAGELATEENWSKVPTEFRQTVGFPGWHVECSAMSMKALGSTLDIHTGGIDHIAIHHTNEIAQSECATGKQFVRYWVHHNFLVVEGQKMSKSLGNFITVEDVVSEDRNPLHKVFDPLALRYLYLQTHYRQEMNFTWEALDAAASSLKKLRQHVISNLSEVEGEKSQGDLSASLRDDKGSVPHLGWMKKFMEALSDDLNTAKALSIVWEMVKENLKPGEKTATLLAMDKILGLELDREQEIVVVPPEVQDLLQDREAFRKAGDYAAADEVRKKIEEYGFKVVDAKTGSTVEKK